LTVIVTGCAGFIGSTLVDRLLARGERVVGIDNFSTGQRRFLDGALKSPAFALIEGDLLDQALLDKTFAGADFVYHFAANADIRRGGDFPRRDLEQNTIATSNVLEAMRANGIRRIAFSSTGAVYGESNVIPTPEDAPLPVQTSLYGASKLASEGQITAYCEVFGFQSWIYRFVSVLGERYTHGHVFDFVAQLLDHPERLRILGDGSQRKSYLHVADCVDAVLLGVERATAPVNIFNLGIDGYCRVSDSAGWICATMGLDPRLDYTGGDRGWPGDNRFVFLDTQRMRALGWQPRLGIREAVESTVRYLLANRWVIEARSAPAPAAAPAGG
jgi:UDP-glucose 4-epimerase